MLKVFPTRLFYFQGQEADIEGQRVSGGKAISGEEDLILTDGGGRVYVQFSDPDLDEPQSALDWRAISRVLKGGTNPIIVPLGDARHQLLGDVTTPIGGSPWWTEADFADAEPHATLDSGAALRATQITVSIASLSAPLRNGIWFSVQHETWGHRSYQIAEILSNDGVTAVVTFDPPFREATDADAPVEFYDPKCTMRVDGDMRSPTTLGYAQSEGVRFVEYPGAVPA